MVKSNKTESETRKYVYKSFTDRIAAVKIDPIRVQGKKWELDENEESYFITAFDHWRELNLTTNFTAFVDKVYRLVRSLPMIIHNQDQVAESLLEHLKAADKLSIEPLTDLVTKLARDLGPDFEKHFPATLHAITEIVILKRSQPELELIESSFGCLAYLFKYLSRLLIADLKPTFDFLSPLFGRDGKQPGYVLRFAAESMSFLIRKSASGPMHDIIDYVFTTMADNPQNSYYIKSLSLLLSNTLKSSGNILHSKTPALMEEMMGCSVSKDRICTTLMADVLVDTLHHARKDTAGPLYESALKFIQNQSKNIEFNYQILFVMSGLRKGDRVTHWAPIYETLLHSLEKSGVEHLSENGVLAIATIISTADFADTTKFFTKVCSLLQSQPSTLVKVYEIIRQQSPQVFNTFVVGLSLQKLLDQQMPLEPLGLFLAKVEGSLPSDKKITLNSANLKRLERSMKSAGSDYALFDLWWRLHSFKAFVKNPSVKLLFDILKLDVSANYRGIQANLVGEIISNCELTSGDIDRVFSALEKLEMRKCVLEGLVKHTNKIDSDIKKQKYALMIAPYTMSWDSGIRHAAVVLCAKLTPHELLDMSSIIDEIPQDLTNARNLSLRIRNLVSKFCVTGNDVTADEVVPRVMFGLLASRFQPIWKESLQLFPQIYEKCGDKAWDLAYQWISNPPQQADVFASEQLEPESHSGHLFECSNLERIQQCGYVTCAEFDTPIQSLKSIAARSANIPVYGDLRSLALKSLIQVPRFAESHGKQLVPYLLGREDSDELSKVAYNDRVTLLELFSKFRKPTKLGSFDEIYDTYLHYLSSKHRPLQKLAVACVLSVNTKETDVLRKYRTNLEALTDDTQFKDETATLFAVKGTERENSIHETDRSIVIPVATRILYGHAKIVKTSTGGSKSNQRGAVLAAMNNYFEPEHQRLFMSIATSDVEFTLTVHNIRRQQGLMSLLSDYIDEFQTNVLSTLDQIVPVLLRTYGLMAQYNLESNSEEITHGMIKVLRQSSTKSLDKLLKLVPSRDVWTQYIDEIYSLLIKPRVERIGETNLEQPSALMQLFLTLSDDLELVDFLAVDDGIIISNLFPALKCEGAKEPVIKLVFGLARNLIEHNVTALVPKFQTFVIDNFPKLLERNLSTQTLELMAGVLNSLAENASSFTEVSLHKIITALLSVFENNSPLSSNIRVALLETLEKMLLHPLCSTDIIDSAYTIMARLFRQFSDGRIRAKLADCYLAFSVKVPAYKRVGELLVELNSYDNRRLGRPDFDRRLAAFEEINERIYSEIKPVEWQVLVYNMLFFMKDPEELSLRNNSVYSLKRLITCYGASKNTTEQELKSLIDGILMPSIRLGMRDSNETFRELYVEILAQIVGDAPAKVPEAGELTPLLMDGDEEANFFNNIFHIQIHRRQRAVLRLAVLAKQGELGGVSISQYLIPLVEHYVQRSSTKSPEINSLAAESVQTISVLARCLTLNQFRAITRRYVNICVKDPMQIKSNIRLVNAVGGAVDAFTHCSGKTREQLSQFCLGEVVSPLHKLMSLKTTNEKNLTERVTIAIPIVLFIKALTPTELEIELPGKLSWLCQLLRAKSQELRDLVRSTLCKVANILGTAYFLFIVKELKIALTRGPQLHILGFTLHSLLVSLQPVLEHGDLDSTVPLMASIMMEDIFGVIGEEKDNENYTTGAKEVKGHKSYDTAFLITENVSLSEIGSLIMPVQEFLLEKKLSLNSERKVVDLLRRFSNGLRKNNEAQTQNAVIAMYQLNEMCLKTQKDEAQRMKELNEDTLDRKSARDRAAKESEEFHTVRLSSREWDGYGYGQRKHVANLHLLQSFILEALRVVLTGEGLLNPANIKGLLPIIEDGIQSNYEDVQISALKLASLCLKVPMNDIKDRALAIGRRALALIKTTSVSSSDLCQACLKLITVILRSVEEFQLKDSAYAYIIDRIKPDIEEPERQSTTISFIRALLSAKVMIPELYEVMEKVSNVMVTNQDPIIRTSCRSAYLRFLLDYPHGQARLDKYFAFLVSNLEYPSSSGRLSVLEMIRMVVNKVHDEQTDTVLTSFFVGLVLVLVNETDQQCRSAALKLVEDIVVRSDAESRQVMVEFCSSWLSYLDHNNSMVRAAFEAAGVMKSREILTDYPSLVKKLDTTVSSILAGSQKGSHEESDWQLVYLALKYIGQGGNVGDKIQAVESTLLYPHPWVRASSARLFGTWYAECKVSSKNIDTAVLTSNAKRFIRQLGAPQVPESHGIQVVKNLVFISQAWLQDDSLLTLKDGTEQPCLQYLIHKLSASARTEINSDDFVGGKQAIVQYFAALTQILDTEQLKDVAPDCTIALYLLLDQLRNDKQQLSNLAQETLELFEKKLGTTEYLKLYNSSRQLVEEKRRERKAKRSVEAVTQPELHQKKRMKKNLALRQSRKRKAGERRRDR